MIYNKKPQEGVFIGVFALATLVVISLAIGFLSNRVNDLLRNQGQMIAGRQAYWLAFSGMETVAQDRLGDLGSPTKGAPFNGTKGDGVNEEEVYDKYYSLAGGEIKVYGYNPAGAGYHNGLARTKHITVTGTDANSVRKIKWTLGSPANKGYNFSFSYNSTPSVTMGSAINSIALDGDFTISAWVQMDAIDERPLFGLEAEQNNHWIQFTSATVMGFKGSGAAVSLTHGLTIPTGSWQHVVITRATNTVTVYLNSIAGGSTVSWNEAFSPDAIGTSNNGTRKYFDGRMTQLALWTRAITLAEIQSIYIQGFTFSLTADLLTGLQHYWKLNNLTDSTAQNNDLTDNNGGANGTGI